jgi:Ca2+-binding RTX toxin-like protein
MTIIHGTNNSETLHGKGFGWEAEPDIIFGHGGFDLIFGYGNNDSLIGGDGNDQLIGGDGADFLDGGAGKDTANYTDSDVGITVNLASGTGSGGAAAGDTLVSIEDITGSWHNDLLIGDANANHLQGTNGNDTLEGRGGNDRLDGGGGADHLDGGSGIDWAWYSGSDSAVVVSLATGIGSWAEASGDTLEGIENVFGSQYNDLLIGDTQINELSGDAGNDTLKGFGGADVLNGGLGLDTASYDESPAGVVVSLLTNSASGGHAQGDALSGIENLTGSAHADNLQGSNGDNVLRGQNGNDTLKGFGGGDTLYGGIGDDYLAGLDGNDTLWGENGHDTLNGGTGVDTMRGGTGNDTYYVDQYDDVVTESGGQGVDVVRTSVSYSLPAGADIETLETTDEDDATPFELFGNSSGNVVRGNAGNNVIGGGDGNDELTGFGGADSFWFGTPPNAMTNIDVITDFNVADDTIELDQDFFDSLGAGNVSAGEFVIGAAAQDANDRIIYNSGTGALLYDSDGSGGSAAIQFAQLNPGLGLTHLDFLVVNDGGFQ